MTRRSLPIVLALLTIVGCAAFERTTVNWWQASREPSGQAPDPTVTPQAVVQVYAARTVGWRGVFGVHTWVAVKREGAAAYRRYEVMGWGVNRGAPAVRVDGTGPDNHWFGAKPELLVDVRGADVDALITRIEAAVAAYPYPSTYRTWPGPNSNTFVAHVGRAVPELRLVLPPTAIGKDFLPGGALIAPSPAGRGLQLSFLGVAGILAGWEEGLEINVLGLTFGIDVKAPALKLPVAGRVGVTPALHGGR